MGIKMNNLLFIFVVFLVIGCSGGDSVFFEKLSYQTALEKAQKVNKSVMVDVFSDG